MTREIVLALDIADDAGRIFDAITTQGGLASFWTPDVTASAEAGSTLRFGFEPAPADLEVTLEMADRGEGVVWAAGDSWPDWSGTTITWSFTGSPTGDGTRVVLVHDGWPDDHADPDLGSVAYTWSLVLGALKGYVESGEPQPALR